MVKKKKGQFYLVAILIIVSLLIGIVTVQNSLTKTTTDRVSQVGDQIAIEKGYVLDYIINNNLSDSAAETILINFSKTYLEEFGLNKDIFFIAGTNNTINLIGNRISNDTIQYDAGAGYQNIADTGEFQKTITTNGSIAFKLPQGDYPFILNPGQNIYYLTRYNYSGEVYIKYG
jgi:hypothetical protein